VITEDAVVIRNNGKAIKYEEQLVDWCTENARKGDYEHFMLKEIHEQPKVVFNTIGDNVLMDQGLALSHTAKDFSILACALHTTPA